MPNIRKRAAVAAGLLTVGLSAAGGVAAGTAAASGPCESGVACLPPSKTACMDGGWQQYQEPFPSPVLFTPFKNQGDCVSFVASEGNSH